MRSISATPSGNSAQTPPANIEPVGAWGKTSTGFLGLPRWEFGESFSCGWKNQVLIKKATIRGTPLQDWCPVLVFPFAKR
jgi:hypothetical protein